MEWSQLSGRSRKRRMERGRTKKKKTLTGDWKGRRERECILKPARADRRWKDSDRFIKEVHFHAETVRRRCEGCGFDTSLHSWLMSPAFFPPPFTPFCSSDCRQVQSSNHLLLCLPPSGMLIGGETHCNEDIVKEREREEKRNIANIVCICLNFPCDSRKTTQNAVSFYSRNWIRFTSTWRASNSVPKRQWTPVIFDLFLNRRL